MRKRNGLLAADLEARCISTARHLSKGFRGSSPPFSLEPLLEHFEVMQVRERPLDRDACLRFDSGRFFIEVNSLYSKPYRRAAIAHEIGHLIVSQCTREGNSHWGHHDKGIEDLCDRLAGELLAPRWAVRRYFESNKTFRGTQDSLKKPALRKVAALFGVPVETISLR